MRELGRKYNGKRTWHHYCGGWSGTQRWTASTSGDNGGGKTALYDQRNGGLCVFSAQQGQFLLQIMLPVLET